MQVTFRDVIAILIVKCIVAKIVAAWHNNNIVYEINITYFLPVMFALLLNFNAEYCDGIPGVVWDTWCRMGYLVSYGIPGVVWET